MVGARWASVACTVGSLFQYSLCRVVLMVHWQFLSNASCLALSVLALSSRFDGPAGSHPDN